MIVTESWRKAVTAGPFGYCRVLLHEDEEFDLASVEQQLHAVHDVQGWVYTTLWISIAVFSPFA